MLHRDNVEKYWDEKHTAMDPACLSSGTIDGLARCFTGSDICATVKSARTVLDIGPGLGRVLGELPDSIAKYAVEVSPAGRARLAAEGVTCFSPYDEPRALEADVAWCVSVIQHCDDAAFARTLEWAGTALREGGRFYLQGVLDDAVATDADRLAAGRFSHAAPIALAGKHGLELIAQNSPRQVPAVPEMRYWTAWYRKWTAQY